MIAQGMFRNASLFNQPIGGWNIAKLTSMREMFSSASAFNANIGSWNTVSVTNMHATFRAASSFNQDISQWNVLRVTSFASQFELATSLTADKKCALSRRWGSPFQIAYPVFCVAGAGSGAPTARPNSTAGLQAMSSAPLDGAAFTTANITVAVGMWIRRPFTTASMYGPITSWDTSAVSSMYQLFANWPSFNENIGGWNVARVANMAVRSACSHRAARVLGLECKR